ncbi:hypothetical protein SCHPADRAFT_894810 [Schizopora paradoxa]|uniref:Uncharacterized protein n=1 Tax=Schizopora paradoxa TaxID=27342 RepID=A0A0H2RQZ7_9AGAM|nr:hypothetical protein SCHPADRAFT_894810 [Schizopora paradoxa]
MNLNDEVTECRRLVVRGHGVTVEALRNACRNSMLFSETRDALASPAHQFSSTNDSISLRNLGFQTPSCSFRFVRDTSELRKLDHPNTQTIFIRTYAVDPRSSVIRCLAAALNRRPIVEIGLRFDMGLHYYPYSQTGPWNVIAIYCTLRPMTTLDFQSEIVLAVVARIIFRAFSLHTLRLPWIPVFVFNPDTRNWIEGMDSPLIAKSLPRLIGAVSPIFEDVFECFGEVARRGNGVLWDDIGEIGGDYNDAIYACDASK